LAPIGKSLNFLALGDWAEIVSRVYDLRRVSGTWQHRVYRNGDLVALDYSAGVFLDRAGKLRPPPQAMLDALVRG
jgi:acyl-CoA thioesterase FadM